MRVSGFVPSLGFCPVPGFHGFHNLQRDLERRVDLTMGWLRGGCFSDLYDPAMGGGQHHGDHLVSAELLTQAPPRGVNVLIEKPLLNGDYIVAHK